MTYPFQTDKYGDISVMDCLLKEYYPRVVIIGRPGRAKNSTYSVWVCLSAIKSLLINIMGDWSVFLRLDKEPSFVFRYPYSK